MTGRMELFDRSRRGSGGESSGPPGLERGAGEAGPVRDGSAAGRRLRADFAAAPRSEVLAERLADRLGGERIREGKRSVLKVTSDIPRGSSHGFVPLAPAEGVDAPALRVLFPLAAERICGEGNLVFFDVETTGLSGGAGTLVFLAGTVRLRGSRIVFTQYFLENLASEPLFLSLLSGELGIRSGSGTVLVSFNGKSFDSNIIKNRLIMNGFRPTDPDPPHIDLLYPARRIWKGRLPDFTLQTLERRVLGVARSGDIPGYRIPEVYFEYLGARETGEDIPSVFAHNRTDTLSLLALFTKQLALVGRLIEGERGSFGEDAPQTGYNPGTLSDMLARSAFGAEARKLLEAHPGDPESLRRLGFLCKRERLVDGALKAFQTLVERADGMGIRGLFDYITACTELSKLFEHALKDLEGARRYTELAIGRIERAELFSPGEGLVGGRARLAREMDELRRRLHRVTRKSGGA